MVPTENAQKTHNSAKPHNPYISESEKPYFWSRFGPYLMIIFHFLWVEWSVNTLQDSWKLFVAPKLGFFDRNGLLKSPHHSFHNRTSWCQRLVFLLTQPNGPNLCAFNCLNCLDSLQWTLGGRSCANRGIGICRSHSHGYRRPYTAITHTSGCPRKGMG
jgi:hypothetical protein